MGHGVGQKPLIIAEKPSAARAIAEALGGFRSARGYMESSDYWLTWAIGHLVELAEPDEYHPRWRRWSLDSLPMIPDSFRLRVVERTRAQVQVIAGLARKANRLVNACDAGREGELIFRYIISILGEAELPVQRLWVSSLTRAAIHQGFRDLKPAEEYDRLYASALCRARGDWLVGMNATRAFTCRFGELFSVGRVQTPSLALLVRREREIHAFISEPYWEVHATFTAGGGESFAAKWFGPDGDRLASAELAEAVVARARLIGQGEVVERQEREVREAPPQLFDLTSLQREANRRFGLTAAATLQAAQGLYERKLITYPRTDSRYLTRDVAHTLDRPLQALAQVPTYAPLVAGADLQRIWTGRVVNEARVTDHHAILPTGEPVPELGGAAARIFDLVARRFLALTYPDAVYREAQVITGVGEDTFRSRGRQSVHSGWRTVEPSPRSTASAAAPDAARLQRTRKETAKRRRAGQGAEQEETDQPALPPVAVGDPVEVSSVENIEKVTQPPRRYTEAMLLAAMETAGKAIEEEELREAMKGRGLGTPATRAAIIERLKTVGYIQVQGKVLNPTEKGERLVALAEQTGAHGLLSPDLTGEWEKRIADIQAGTFAPEQLMVGMQNLAAEVVAQVRRTPGVPQRPQPLVGAEGTPLGTCPRCTGRVARRGREWRCGGCGLRIPGYLCGKLIEADVAGILLREGRTPLLQGFHSTRTGKTFAAYLVLESEEVGFDFPPAGRRGVRKRSGTGTDASTARRKGRAADKAGKGRKDRTPGKGGATAPGETGV